MEASGGGNLIDGQLQLAGGGGAHLVMVYNPMGDIPPPNIHMSVVSVSVRP